MSRAVGAGPSRTRAESLEGRVRSLLGLYSTPSSFLPAAPQWSFLPKVAHFACSPLSHSTY